MITEPVLPAAHAGLAPAHEWQTPARQLNIVVTKEEAVVTCDAIGFADQVDWQPAQGQVESAIAGARDTLDRLRDRFPGYWDGIAANGLLPALSRYVPRQHDWLPRLQPPPQEADWGDVVASTSCTNSRTGATASTGRPSELARAASSRRHWIPGTCSGLPGGRAAAAGSLSCHSR